MQKGYLITNGETHYCGLMRVRKPVLSDKDDPVIFESPLEAETALALIEEQGIHGYRIQETYY